MCCFSRSVLCRSRVISIFSAFVYSILSVAVSLFLWFFIYPLFGLAVSFCMTSWLNIMYFIISCICPRFTPCELLFDAYPLCLHFQFRDACSVFEAYPPRTQQKGPRATKWHHEMAGGKGVATKTVATKPEEAKGRPRQKEMFSRKQGPW